MRERGLLPCVDCYYCKRRDEDFEKYEAHPIFHEKQAVWVRTSGSTFWPAQVVNPERLENARDGTIGVAKELSSTHMVTVLYFNGGNGYSTHSDIIYQHRKKVISGFGGKNYEKYSKGCHRPNFEKAVEEAKSYYDDKEDDVQKLDPPDTSEIFPEMPTKRGQKTKKGRKREKMSFGKSYGGLRKSSGTRKPENGNQMDVELPNPEIPAPSDEEELRPPTESITPEQTQPSTAESPSSESQKKHRVSRRQYAGIPPERVSSRTLTRLNTERSKRIAAGPRRTRRRLYEKGDDVTPEELLALTYEESMGIVRTGFNLWEQNSQKDKTVAQLTDDLNSEKRQKLTEKRKIDQMDPLIEEREDLKRSRFDAAEYAESREQFGLIAEGKACVEIAKHLLAVHPKVSGPKTNLIVYHAAKGNWNEIQEERRSLSEHCTLVDTPRELMQKSDIVLYYGSVDPEELYSNLIANEETGLMAAFKAGEPERDKDRPKPGLVVMRQIGVEHLTKIEQIKRIESKEVLFLFAAAVGVDGNAAEGNYNFVAAGHQLLYERCKMIYDHIGKGSPQRCRYMPEMDIPTCSMFVEALDRLKHTELLNSYETINLLRRIDSFNLSQSGVMWQFKELGADLARGTILKAVPALDGEGDAVAEHQLHSAKRINSDIQREVSLAADLEADTLCAIELLKMIRNEEFTAAFL